MLVRAEHGKEVKSKLTEIENTVSDVEWQGECHSGNHEFCQMPLRNLESWNLGPALDFFHSSGKRVSKTHKQATNPCTVA